MNHLFLLTAQSSTYCVQARQTRAGDPASRLSDDATESAGVAVRQKAPVPWFRDCPGPCRGRAKAIRR